MKKYVFDIEFDSLTPTVIKVLSYAIKEGDSWVIKTISDISTIKRFFEQKNCWFIGHNIIQFDIPAVLNLLSPEIAGRLIDTLPISWYLYPKRNSHSVESYGVDFGVDKIQIEDWESASIKELTKRCEVDVEITIKMWEMMLYDLDVLYEGSDNISSIIDYLTFKVECIHLASVSKWKLDKQRAANSLSELIIMREEKILELKDVMPKVPVVGKMVKPKNFFKRDGSITKQGYAWLDIKYDGKIPEKELLSHTSSHYNNEEDTVEYIKDYKQPNPNSGIQLKKWLFSLGWQPVTFRYEPNKNGKGNRAIAQIYTTEKELCESIRVLEDKEPAILVLDSLGVISHRISILEGFLKNCDKDGFLIASASGITNTLRMKHSGIVNLPKMSAKFGKHIRTCLIAEDGYELVEADIKSLENMTRNHFIFPYDPEYVKTMSGIDYDSHTDLCVEAGYMSKDEELFYKWFKKEYKD